MTGCDDDYSYVGDMFLNFLMSFRVYEESYYPFYNSEVDAMEFNKPNTMRINFTHVMKYSDNLQRIISDKYLMIEMHLQNACKEFLLSKRPSFSQHDFRKLDINVAFYDLPLTKRLRELTCSQLGELVSVTGVVTHTSEPPICLEHACQNRQKWELVTRKSKFADSQMVRMQEIFSDIPAGSPPRSIDVILRHDIVEQARAGDRVIFTGSVVMIPSMPLLSDVGQRVVLCRGASQRRNDRFNLRGLKAVETFVGKELSYRLAFIANSVKICDDRMHCRITNMDESVDEDENSQFTHQELAAIGQMRNVPDFFNKLVDCIAPTVFGHRDIKAAILLMLLGGVRKSTYEGINLRGNIHVCIVGDPSCAKSQFLKYTSGMVSHSVYTSGKSSTAAGLTATVARERETGEFCIEAGALMIADNGICCIDEFDKMNLGDQLALYEAMEQQTISITKAGIHATLEVQTSVLAAANPSSGYYDKTKSLKYNVALPRALLSRFDLIYVMIDEPDDKIDLEIAQCIVRHHQKDNPVDSPFSTTQVKRFILYAKTLEPNITAEARKELVDSYVGLRNDSNNQQRFVLCATVRQLEALIRLSEAIARSHLDNKVRRNHVQMAMNLLKKSFVSVESSEIDLTEFQETQRNDGVDNSENGTGLPTEAPAESVNGNAGNGAGTSSKQGNELIVTEEYFKKVSCALIQQLRQHEETVKQKGTGLSGMRQKDLVLWYIDKQMDNHNLVEVRSEITKVKAIIESLIKKEGQLIVISDNEQAGEESGSQSTSKNDRILDIAPNYAAGD